MRRLFGAILTTVIGLTVWAAATDGFQAFTSEGARRLDIARTPRAIPDAKLRDAHDQRLQLSDFTGTPLLVDFFFTRCQGSCAGQTRQLARLAAQLGDLEVNILSLSLDPERDHREELSLWQDAFARTHANWTFAAVADHNQPQILEAFGITALAVEGGQIEHNAAIHVVSSDGQLSAIFDYNQPGAIRSMLEQW